jgi:tetratricopeptide (TPR) repeat protein
MDDMLAHLINQAKSHLQWGNEAEALALFQEAADRARQSGDVGRLAFSLRHICALACDQNKGDIALSAGQEAVAIYRERAEKPLDLANALRVNALALAAIGESDQAVPCWAEARAIYLSLDIASGVAEADRWLAITPRAGPPTPP